VIRISDNTIIDGKFYVRGTPLPYASVADMPEILKPLVVTGEPEEDEGPDVARGAFELNRLYAVRDDGRLGRQLQRKVERDIAEMERAAQEQDWIEEEMDAPLPPAVAESLQAEHENAVAFAKAQLEADARRSDAASDAAAAALEPPQLYVRRGDRHYQPAHRARLRPGEAVYIRNQSGGLECIGTTDGHSQLPDPPTIIT
jgi:hypothetical protein